MQLAIVDTGCANLASVAFAFERLGAEHIITQDPDVIYGAQRVVLPGVGAAGYAMDQLRQRELIPVLQNLVQPVLGICLGMQMIFNRSAEGNVDCLGLVNGEIKAMETGELPSPHMGWNTLDIIKPGALLEGLTESDYAYFVHSYAAPVSDVTLAKTAYGSDFSAVVAHKNVYGCQFHPERSSQTGARILKNFLDLPA